MQRVGLADELEEKATDYEPRVNAGGDAPIRTKSYASARLARRQAQLYRDMDEAAQSTPDG
ncbi:hypothetical protein ACPW96_19340 [Micromonospora sp. DT81.3]|uniref:hypothetical protein n=1 Tax=Micromonospora sp. DT81.3 TaxID=3416523 RepID=UPI003CE71346